MCVAQIHAIFFEPFPQGIDNIRAGFSGEKVDYVFQQAVDDRAPLRREISLSLFERVSALVIGVILLIPIINAVVFAILQAVHSSFVFQRVTQPAPPIHLPFYPYPNPAFEQPLIPDEDLLQGRNDGVAPHVPELREPPATPEEYQQRKNEALAQLPDYPDRDHLHFECSRAVLEYDLDAVLATFNEYHDLRRFTELFDYSEFDPANRRNLINCLNRYDRYHILNDQQRMIKTLLSKLFDFFQTNRPLFPEGTEQANLFKEEIRNVFNKIIDAHLNCEDQVLSQMESIISETIAKSEALRGNGAPTLKDKILHLVAFALSRYRSNLIKEICTAEYPEEPHMPTLERLVKRRLAQRMGLQGAVFNIGAHYEYLIQGQDTKVTNIARIFSSGQASVVRMQEEAAEGRIDDRRVARRRESKYNPEQYLINALQTYHGPAQWLRNEIFIWARQYFNLEDNDPLTTRFIRALSEDPDGLNASEGGNLTHQATLFLLETLGIFKNNDIAQAAVL